VYDMISELQTSHIRCGALRIVHDKDPNESVFTARLVEDRVTSSTRSYIEFLCHLHKEIQTRLG